LKSVKESKMRKGVEPVLVAFVVAAVLIGGMGLYYITLTYQLQTTVEMVRESTIINAINFVESTKTALDDAVGYSIHKAADSVLFNGGFCEHILQSSDSGYCSEECKIPDETPTYQCKPWWKINDELYAPTRETFVKYMKNRTLQNFEEYARMLEVQDLEMPDYCPPLERDCSGCLDGSDCPEGCEGDREVGGVVTLSTIPGSDSTIRAFIESKNDYLQNSKIVYTGEFFSIVDNSSFSATVKSTAISMFDFARDQFIEDDYVSQKFDEASDIANQWCEIRDSTEIYYGNVCPNNLPTCSADLSEYCKEDYNMGSGCRAEDYNCDGTITSDEYYNHTVKSRLLGNSQGADEYGNVFTTSIGLADCIKVGVEGAQVYSELVEVDWKSYDPVTHQEECGIINEENCGCWETCTASDLECGECATVTAGIYEGPCPWGTLTCPDECCGVEYECREWTVESCEGTVDSSECTDPVTNCDQDCCVYSATQVLSATESSVPYYVLADGPECAASVDCVAIDTDGGYDLYEKGICSWRICRDGVCEVVTSQPDSCIDDTKVYEMRPGSPANYCTGSIENCPSGYTCSNGACVGDAPPTACNDIGLGAPFVSPSNPAAGEQFYMYCPVDQDHIGADCIYANANGLSYQCDYVDWFYNSARFICPGLPPGTYTARCTATTGSDDNCCYDIKTRSYTVGGAGQAYCNRKSCGDISPVNGACPCGCTETSKVMHEITLKCRSSACGFDCCKKAAYLEDTKCIFDYAGTAAVSVEVSDTSHTYPIESEPKNLKLPFYVVSGNAVGQDLLCEANTTDDDPSTVEVEFPEWQYCKEPHVFTITVGVDSGSGTLNVYKDDVLLGSVTESLGDAIFGFEAGSTADFEAVPSSGFTLESYCGRSAESEELVCCTPEEGCTSPLTRKINADGFLYVNFGQ
jgi:hypothetical protein